jgi:hypothetical protein
VEIRPHSSSSSCKVPAPVAAEALDFHHTTTQRQRAAAGGTGSRYATRRYGRIVVRVADQ